MDNEFNKRKFYNEPIADPEKPADPEPKKELERSLAHLINLKILEAVINYGIINTEKKVDYESNPFEELVSMGELVDRLSIVNFKLFKLKDDVMSNRKDDETFRAWASVEDVKLVMERARLKRCIDEKLLTIIKKVKTGDETGGFNPEVKKYGSL